MLLSDGVRYPFSCGVIGPMLTKVKAERIC